jgi:signal transduction histidine kinase
LDKYTVGEHHIEDIIRFNEAIDQAITESVNFFATQVDQSRDLFLGMLGHDMRSPLQTVQATAAYLAALNASAEVTDAAARLINSGRRMKALLDDLVDFNRTKLGLGIEIAPTEIDVAQVFGDELKQLRAAHRDRRMELEVSGETRGLWDGLRLQQLLSNLVVNAIKYGAPDAPVRITVAGEMADLHFEVRNSGTIDSSTVEYMFDPLRRGLDHATNQHGHDSLGLGLFIAREIVSAHNGEIEARCDGAETVFSVRLPRRSETDSR